MTRLVKRATLAMLPVLALAVGSVRFGACRFRGDGHADGDARGRGDLGV